MTENKKPPTLNSTVMPEAFESTQEEMASDWNEIMLAADRQYQYGKVYEAIETRLNQWSHSCKQPTLRADVIHMARYLRLAIDRWIEGGSEADIKELLLDATAIGIRCLLENGDIDAQTNTQV